MQPTATRLAYVIAKHQIRPNPLTGAPAKVFPRLAHEPLAKAPTTFELLQNQRTKLLKTGEWPANIRLEAGVPKERMNETRRKDRRAYKEVMTER